MSEPVKTFRVVATDASITMVWATGWYIRDGVLMFCDTRHKHHASEAAFAFAPGCWAAVDELDEGGHGVHRIGNRPGVEEGRGDVERGGGR